MPSIPRHPQTGLVYLLRLKDMEYFKVGVSVNRIDLRLAKLQTGSPFLIEVVATREHADPYNVEFFIHKELLPYRVRNEWFHGPYEIIREVYDRHSFMASTDESMKTTAVYHRERPRSQRIAKDARPLEELALLKMADGSYAYPKYIIARMVTGRRTVTLQKIRELRGEE